MYNLILVTILSIKCVSGYYRQAEWEKIGGINYDFNPAPLTQADAKKYCIANGGRLFEPRTSKINRDVFLRAGAKLNGATDLWIGISDIGAEGLFKYISDETDVGWKCEASAPPTGCWRTSEPVVELALTGLAAGSRARANAEATQNLDCVVGSSGTDGQWAVKGCSVTPPTSVVAPVAGAAGPPVVVADPGSAAVPSTPSRFGCICEQAVAPSTTTQPPESTTTKKSDSTCLKTGITLMIGMLFFCYQ